MNVRKLISLIFAYTVLVLSGTGTPVRAQVSGRTVFAVRTNAVAPLMNAGFEVPLGNVVSLEADGWFPWLLPQVTGGLCCVQAYYGTAGVRFWFDSKRRGDRLLGHSLAAKAGMVQFDLGWNVGGAGDYHLTGRQGKATEAHLDYLYAFRLGKDLRMEVGVGAGAVYHRDFAYDQYARDGQLLRDPRLIETRGWFFGPVMASVNVVLPVKSRGGVR